MHIRFQLRSLTSSCPLGGRLPLQFFWAFIRFADRIGMQLRSQPARFVIYVLSRLEIALPAVIKEAGRAFVFLRRVLIMLISQRDIAYRCDIAS